MTGRALKRKRGEDQQPSHLKGIVFLDFYTVPPRSSHLRSLTALRSLILHLDSSAGSQIRFYGNSAQVGGCG